MTSGLIPRLADLCYANDYSVAQSTVIDFVQRHEGNWRSAQDHWELLMSAATASSPVAAI